MRKSSFNGVYQNHYIGDVIFRMFNEDKKQMQEFHEEYGTHLRHRGADLLPPTKKEIEMAEMWAKGAIVREVAQKFHVTQNHADAAIRKVAKYRLRQATI